MKRNLYNHDAHIKAKMTAHTSEADYAHAMKMYRVFACASGIVLTVAYAALQLF